MPGYILKAVCDHDYEAERSLMNRGTQRNVWYISCGGLVKNKQLMEDMQTMMQTLQQEYGQPVDIEFTINVSEEGEYVINLLQCRPLQAFEDSGRQGIPEDLNDDEVVLDCSKSTLGKSQKTPVDLILYVDPVAYYEMPFKQKREVTKWISAVNWYYRDKDNYITATSTVDFINYTDYGRLYISFDEKPEGVRDDCFFIAGKNLDIMLERGIREKLQMGSEVTITYAPKIFGDGYVVPIAAIAVDGEELLSFEEGYPNLIEWLKKN
jgi:hypothetical protein